jgi:hypothetical protein
MDAVSTAQGARFTFKQGKVVQKSFGDYPWATIGDTPGITVVVVASDAPVGDWVSWGTRLPQWHSDFFHTESRTVICGSVSISGSPHWSNDGAAIIPSRASSSGSTKS